MDTTDAEASAILRPANDTDAATPDSLAEGSDIFRRDRSIAMRVKTPPRPGPQTPSHRS